MSSGGVKTQNRSSDFRHESEERRPRFIRSGFVFGSKKVSGGL